MGYQTSLRERRCEKSELTMEPRLPSIPDEIVLEILSRLPVKSMMRFKCVCRAWRALLSDPNFTISTERQRRLVMASAIPNTYSVSLQSITMDTNQGCSVEELHKPWDQSLCTPARVLGSCDGLLLISCFENIYMWNPSTMDYKKVLTYLDFNLKHVIHGLCYDPFTNDYKVVIGIGGEYSLVQVCSFKSQNERKEIPFPGYYVPLRNSGPLVSGNLHWLVAKEREITEDAIIYFDPVKDEFGEVPMPCRKNRVEKRIIGLGELDGCLAVTRPDDKFYTSVWAMKKYGDEETWTTLFKISSVGRMKLCCHILEPLCTTKDGEVLLLVDAEQINAYNPEKGSHRCVWIPRKDYCITSGFMYDESVIKLTRKS